MQDGLVADGAGRSRLQRLLRCERRQKFFKCALTSEVRGGAMGRNAARSRNFSPASSRGLTSLRSGAC